MRNTERLYDRVIEKMDMTCDMEDEELQELKIGRASCRERV